MSGPRLFAALVAVPLADTEQVIGAAVQSSAQLHELLRGRLRAVDLPAGDGASANDPGAELLLCEPGRLPLSGQSRPKGRHGR